MSKARLFSLLGGICCLAGASAFHEGLGDSPELRASAHRQRDEGVLHPGMEDYGAQLAKAWGGPASGRWYEQALTSFPRAHGVWAAGRTVLVTGGMGGIGFYTAQLLVAAGMKLVLPARSGLVHETEGAASAIRLALPGAVVTIPSVPLDLESLQSVRAFGAHLRADSELTLDAVVLNAGRGGASLDALERTADGLETIMQVNLFGHALLIHELLPVLRRGS